MGKRIFFVSSGRLRVFHHDGSLKEPIDFAAYILPPDELEYGLVEQCQPIYIYNARDNDVGVASASWVILTHNRDWYLRRQVAQRITAWSEDELNDKVLWTDDFASRWEVLKWD